MTLPGKIEFMLKEEILEEQIRILRICLDHALTHPWTDEEHIDSILENIANDPDLP